MCLSFYSSSSQKLKRFRRKYSPEYQLFLDTKLILFHYFFQKFGSARKGLTSVITQTLCLKSYFRTSSIMLLREAYINPCKPGLLRVVVSTKKNKRSRSTSFAVSESLSSFHLITLVLRISLVHLITRTRNKVFIHFKESIKFSLQ